MIGQRATVETGARLHFGFRNLSAERDRIYGSLGVALDEPRVVVSATPADTVVCQHETARKFARQAVSLLDVDGATVTVESALPRHFGLGSGTQLALATATAIAAAHDCTADIRALAPRLGRGRRSGIGVATFEAGGFVIDAGQPTETVVPDPPSRGEWTVPDVEVRRPVPSDWRFLVVQPDATPGKHGSDESRSLQAVAERAESSVSDEIDEIVGGDLLTALEAEHPARFGRAMAEIDVLNGSWFADEQQAIYRHPVDELIECLTECAAVFGAGQSSWGPAVYGLTTADRLDAARRAAERALAKARVDGTALMARASNTGHRITTGNCHDRNY